YATAMPTRGSAIPLLVRSDDGRPTKVEGNLEHPDSNGGTDTFAQASVLSVYDPDRAQRFTVGGSDASRAKAFDALNELARNAAGKQGQGLAFLVERSNSPSRIRLTQAIKQKLPQAKWFAYEPVDFDIHRQAGSLAAGKSVTPYFRFDQASTILSLDCDFVGAENDTYLHCRNFARGRGVKKAGDKMNRLYQVEPLMTQTGMSADHRLRVAGSQVIAVAAAIAAKLNVQVDASKFALPAHVKPQWIDECAKDLAANKGTALVVAGYRQPLAVHLIANAINAALGANGKTVQFRETPDLGEGNIAQLAQALNGGQVETFVILGGNPVFTAPADLDWAATQRKAKNVVRLGYYEDETFAATDIHIPAAHYLEAWGDARTADGTIVPVQPLIQPLFGGLSEIEVLAFFAGVEPSGYKIARETFGGNDEAWKKYLHDGFIAGSALKPIDVQLNAAALGQAIAQVSAGAPSKDQLEVIFTRDYKLDDGRWANNAWLMELPDPVTKMSWDNAILISRKTAAELGLKNSQIVEVELSGRKIRGGVWVVPGQADYTLGLSLGFGREKGGRIANFNGGKTGFNFYPLRTTVTGNIAVGAKVTGTKDTYSFACTQDHWSLEGRTIIREANLKDFNEHPDFAKGFDFPEPPGGNQSLYPNPLDWKRDATHQWGMAIDLSQCVGCNACTLACQSENNIPTVGKDQVRRGREMHWLRIDRYFSGNPELEKGTDSKNARNVLRPDSEQYQEQWIDDPQAVNQPMMCQHCEAAPCENVCPVNATVHDQEGLNLMVYNRCVGTRYCSNNCPWKVRRFNYFDYSKRPIENLYKPTTTFKPTKPEDEFELLKLVRNPDVTVRMRGVMEKCTFCVQRIEGAKIGAKVKAGQSAPEPIKDLTIKTACQQACPAEAIVFGNINDPKSAVSQLKASPRNYTTLEFLNTKPRLTYLARVRNPNPAMPDYYDMPLTAKAYFDKAGHHEAHDSAAGTNAPGAKKGAH
ncbi:MAG TPA: 4Fe-4S dicluster domain-containing protein, partial [Candidatus Acidoferrum sp.]|nr:4Fe-4S dicluster domain-containing protein [Candidatus Acidoferrum sp.]